MGTCTFSTIKVLSVGNLRGRIGDLTMSSSYATGGDAAAPSLFGLQEVDFIDTINVASTAIAISPVFSGTPGTYQSKIQAWDTTAPTTPVNAAGQVGVEVLSTTNLSTTVVRCMVWGF